MESTIERCKFCNSNKIGSFCSACGRSIVVKRISLKSIIHEIFHFFTHFDKGFPYTLKKLFSEPGTMQREYVDGNRYNDQKPFSMFFICASFTALSLYWINISLHNYFDAGNSLEADFFHKYWVFLQIALLPVYSLITYLFFIKSRFNYAEILVQQLYLFSMIFLLLAAIHLLKFIFPQLQTRYIELPAITIYCVITNINFFNGKKVFIVLTTMVTIAINFFIASYLQDLLVGN